jgi:hypothetical protein
MKFQGNNKIILNGRHKADNNSNYVSAFERIAVDLETSIKFNDNSSNDIIIFPNPVKETLYFNKKTAFEILDIYGNILLKWAIPVESVNIDRLKTGIYLIRLENCVQKFVKE